MRTFGLIVLCLDARRGKKGLVERRRAKQYCICSPHTRVHACCTSRFTYCSCSYLLSIELWGNKCALMKFNRSNRRRPRSINSSTLPFQGRSVGCRMGWRRYYLQLYPGCCRVKASMRALGSCAHVLLARWVLPSATNAATALPVSAAAP